MNEAAIETTEIAQKSTSALAEAKAFKITSPQQYELSGVKLLGIKAMMKEIDDLFDKHIKRAFEAHRDLIADKKKYQSPLQTAEALLKTAILGYQQDQERTRREAEARAQEEARREREKLEERSAKLAARGRTEKAEAVAAAAAAVVTPILPTTTAKLSGISSRTTYSAHVTDLMLLVQAIAAGTVPLNAVTANMPFLNNQARAMKETLDYPGVKAVATTGLAA